MNCIDEPGLLELITRPQNVGLKDLLPAGDGDLLKIMKGIFPWIDVERAINRYSTESLCEGFREFLGGSWKGEIPSHNDEFMSFEEWCGDTPFEDLCEMSRADHYYEKIDWEDRGLAGRARDFIEENVLDAARFLMLTSEDESSEDESSDSGLLGVFI